MSKTNVTYQESLRGQTVKKVEFELLSDIIFAIEYISEDKIKLSLEDKITDNTQLDGFVDYDLLNVTIRWLTKVRNQMKEQKNKEDTV